jgi:hypothetical protein
MAKLMRRSTRLAALVVTLGMLALAPAAYGQGTAGSGYGGDGGENVGNVESGTQGGEAKEAGGLPFTGLDVSLILGGGLILVATGAGLGRVVARHSEL